MLFLLVSIFFKGLVRVEVVEESVVESSSEAADESVFVSSTCFWGFCPWVLICFNGFVTEVDDGVWEEKLVSFLQQILFEGVIMLAGSSAPKVAEEDMVETKSSGSNRTSIVK